MKKTQEKSAKRTQYSQKKARAMMKWFDENIDCYKSFLIEEIRTPEEVKDLTWFFPDDIRDWLRDSWHNACWALPYIETVEVKPLRMHRVKLTATKTLSDANDADPVSEEDPVSKEDQVNEEAMA